MSRVATVGDLMSTALIVVRDSDTIGVADAQISNLAAHRGGVFRNLRREIGELIDDDKAQAAHGAKRKQHRQQHADEARNSPAIE